MPIMKVLPGIVICLIQFLPLCSSEQSKNTDHVDDICGHIQGQRIYLEHGEGGTLTAKRDNNIIITNLMNNTKTDFQKRCIVDFITCPSCIIKIKFKFLNLSRNCGRSTIFDSCSCGYVLIYEPTFEQSSEQFCGRFIESNKSTLEYTSQTRKIVVVFLYNRNYEHAFTMNYCSERNKQILIGYPTFSNTNNATQIISSPFFPNQYLLDLTREHIIQCESKNEICRISLVFTDFLIAHSSIMDFFDWNGERLYVTTGNIFRPPVITTTGPLLIIKFYANGASSFGYKAYYSFILGQANDMQLKPDIDCGGHVNNLGGEITMMNMISDGLKFFDCIWLIKPPDTHSHMKTHLYIKVLTYSGFAGNTDLTIRQGLTSNGPVVENLKMSLVHFHPSKNAEHVVSISQGFYISLKGVFRPESHLALVYAAFSYKNCLSGSDFLCRNLRCISSLLNCDGFDHCNDNSDELAEICSQDPRDRRQWSKTPNFFFPQVESFANITTSTLIFMLCSLGLVGVILITLVLLHKVNSKTRQEQQIQNHIETINAILEEGTPEVEEEIIIPDDPPDYEAPPDYDDVIKMLIESKTQSLKILRNSTNYCLANKLGIIDNNESENTSQSCQTTPDSPPPPYNIGKLKSELMLSRKINKTFQESQSLRRQQNVVVNTHRLIHVAHDTTRNKYFSGTELSQPTFSTTTMSVLQLAKNRKSFTTDDVNSFI